jgi:RNA polymerase sigma factor (sigma-70 family)
MASHSTTSVHVYMRGRRDSNRIAGRCLTWRLRPILFVSSTRSLQDFGVFLRSFGRLVSPDDIAQDAFLKLCAADARQIVSPRAFLIPDGKNMAVDALRRHKAAPYRAVASIDLVPTAAHAPSPEDHCIAAEEAAALRAAIAALPELERKALLMRRVELLPPAEVAAALGVSERQVQRLVLKAIAFLSRQAHRR